MSNIREAKEATLAVIVIVIVGPSCTDSVVLHTHPLLLTGTQEELVIIVVGY